MRAYASLSLAIVAIACALLLARGNASAATASLELAESGPAISFQWYYTVTLSPGDSACSTPPQLKLTWDNSYDLGSAPLDCETLTASGVVLPPASDNAPGIHDFCVGGGSALAPRQCATFEIKAPGTPRPLSPPSDCDGDGVADPGPCPTTTPFEPDCVPTGLPQSPLCVTVTPIPYCDDGSHTLNSPPCADAMTSTPTAEPAVDPSATPPDPCDAPGTPAPSCTTPSHSPTPTRTPTRTPPPSCPTTAADATPAACATRTSGNDQSSGGGGLHVKWGAVAIAGGVVVTLGAAGGAGFWWRTRP